MANQLQDLEVQCVSLVDRAAVRDPQNKSEPRRFLLCKREGTTPTQGGADMTEQEMRAAVEKAERDAKEATQKAESEREAREKAEHERDEALAKAEAKDGDGENDGDEDDGKKKPVNKAELSPEVRAALEKAEKDAADARSEIAKAQAQASEAAELAKSERDARVTREFVAKAEGYKALPVKPADFGPVLKRANETLTKEDYAELDRILSAVDVQLAKSDLFKEMGRSSGGGSLPDGAYEELVQKAQELRKADPKLTEAEAQATVMKTDKDLQARYVAERG